MVGSILEKIRIFTYYVYMDQVCLVSFIRGESVRTREDKIRPSSDEV